MFEPTPNLMHKMEKYISEKFNIYTLRRTYHGELPERKGYDYHDSWFEPTLKKILKDVHSKTSLSKVFERCFNVGLGANPIRMVTYYLETAPCFSGNKNVKRIVRFPSRPHFDKWNGRTLFPNYETYYKYVELEARALAYLDSLSHNPTIKELEKYFVSKNGTQWSLNTNLTLNWNDTMGYVDKHLTINNQIDHEESEYIFNALKNLVATLYFEKLIERLGNKAKSVKKLENRKDFNEHDKFQW